MTRLVIRVIRLLAAGIMISQMVVSEARGDVTLKTLVTFTFNGTNGSNLQGGLTLGNDGDLYGTTSIGGPNPSHGTIFRMSPDGAFTRLFSFTNYTLAASPSGTLVRAPDGNFYGTTSQGGTNHAGIVFRITPGGTFSPLASLPGICDGGLIQGNDGYLYGTTYFGGTNGGGSVFRVSTNGTLTTVASMDSAAHPQAGLMQASDGNFYGTTTGDGSYGDGTIFQMTPQGSLTTVASFDSTSGVNSQAGLVQASDGSFYGTCASGGANSDGTVFRMTLNGLTGTITPLVTFNGTDGAEPVAKLIQADDGNLYGTTGTGGTNGDGTIFRLSTNGTFTHLYSFTGGTNGYQPWTELTQGTNGDFYGTTGGTGGAGTIFAFNPNWPVILTQPLSRTNLSGTTAAFTISADGPGPLSYRWQKDGTNLDDGGNISGTDTTNLTISGVLAPDAGVYTAIVSNAFGVVSSAGAVLTLATAPVITNSPVSQTNFYSWTTIFTVSATGIPSPTYRWQKDGTNLTDNNYITGSTNSTLTLRDISYGDAGTYFVVMSNEVATVTNSVVLVVTNELIQNGSFETKDYSGWNLSGNGGVSGIFAFFAHSGLYSMQLDNTPSSGTGHFSQTISTTPGTTYLISLWFIDRYGFTPNEFFVSWNTNSGSTNIIFDQTNIPMTGWENLQFVATAASDTTTLDIGFLNTFNLDDVVVLPVAPADSPPPKLTNVKFSPESGTQLQINVNVGNSYRLQVSSNLLDWVTLTNFIPFDNSVQIDDPQAASVPARFYRVISP